MPSEPMGQPRRISIRVAFVRHRFTGRLVAYDKGDRWYGRLDNVLNLTSIGAGAAAAIAGGVHAKPWVLIVLGSIVATLQTFSQWLKPSQRSSRRGHAAARLRDEGWDFVLGQDRYKGKDSRNAWTIFYGEVNKIAQQEEAVEDQEGTQAALPSKERKVDNPQSDQNQRQFIQLRLIV